MEIKSLQNLVKNGNVYELYTQVAVNNSVYGIYQFVCEKRHNMRIDTVCFDIYENTNNIDILMTLNGILNPLVIQEGDIILFLEDFDIDEIRVDTNKINAILDSFKNANKGKEFKIDKNRIKDLAKRTETEKKKQFLPPNIVDINQPQVIYKDGKIIMKPNF